MRTQAVVTGCQALRTDGCSFFKNILSYVSYMYGGQGLLTEKRLTYDDHDTNRNNDVVDGEGFEPSTSAMPTLRSFQTDLPALSRHLHRALLTEFLRVLLSGFPQEKGESLFMS